ncbi:hypothetical protein BV22DRAFT_1039262 [Leucogyrophana mollusca]|uniref:Uncharacterized protein n=1 Tax=Leucogyrophana mollusca TaxID=85980 RepID=A0ACB8B7N0_9AGAM|nr:hypothetical protein BV22DRAFT_1039262 [Leucogyrophana mollusca]
MSMSDLGSAEPISLHVYRRGGLLSDQRIVKAEDKVTMLYYTRCSRNSLQWKFALFADGPDGTLVCEVDSTYTGNMPDGIGVNQIVVRMAPEKRPIPMQRRHGLDGTHWFKGPDHKEYRWKSVSYRWKNDMQCLDNQNGVVATYRVTSLAVSKDGELCVYPSGQFMIDLLVATSLAMRTPNH